jgi:hypothetical protein
MLILLLLQHVIVFLASPGGQDVSWPGNALPFGTGQPNTESICMNAELELQTIQPMFPRLPVLQCYYSILFVKNSNIYEILKVFKKNIKRLSLK